MNWTHRLIELFVGLLEYHKIIAIRQTKLKLWRFKVHLRVLASWSQENKGPHYWCLLIDLHTLQTIILSHLHQLTLGGYKGHTRVWSDYTTNPPIRIVWLYMNNVKYMYTHSHTHLLEVNKVVNVKGCCVGEVWGHMVREGSVVDAHTTSMLNR